MSRPATIQQAVIGEVLPNIGRRHAGMRSDAAEKALLLRLGTRQHRAARAMTGNAQRTPQSVVKRVRNGGTRTAKELRRQLEYITRDEAVKSTWLNFNGIERGLYKNSVETTVPLWTSSWVGNPNRGHTDHIILSFPKDTDVGAAEEIAKEWGRAVFGSGDFGDQWRYVAALHANTDHVHAHFVVDKRGIDHGQFLSISMKSELNYDVMRELHAKIAGEHGVALNASSRLSRGIVDHPPRETEYRAAHDDLKTTGKETPTVRTPSMSVVERMKREALVHSFSKQYRAFSSIAQMASDEEGQGGYMEKLSGMFTAASDLLKVGGSLMTATDIDTPHFDPAARLAQAQEQMVEAAREAWADIQGMEPGAERARLEEQFAEQTRIVRDATVSEPFMEQHGSTIAPGDDPYSIGLVRDLHSVRDHFSGEPEAIRAADMAMDTLRERLEAAFTAHEDRLESAGTNAEEMAQRFMLSSRSNGQIEAWREGGYDRDFAASDIVQDDIAQLRAEYADLERDLTDEAANIFADYEVPRDLQEVMARDQLIYGERYQRLVDVPAIEMIVERMTQELSEDDLDAVRAGDYTALREEIKDPAIRAAVGSELRNEADVSNGGERHSEPVDQFQQLARQSNAAKVSEVEKVTETDLSDDYGL